MNIGNRPPLIARGRTFWVDFDPDSRGHETAELHPAIVISAPELSAGGTCTVVPTTTKRLDVIRPYEVLIQANHGVPKDCKAVANQFRTIDIRERLREPIGRLDDDIMRQLDVAILIVLFGPEMAR